ncbi:hypothetical protein SAMN05216565_101258 [Litchfieldia salsa]|uniref:Uncharacterized protein n=1 Tax=Litchfieldia salsa TaxID=930152 RepID=A0A1H0PCD4_9BACI|nr:hypothetical protein SAMN05216565_101258 [Litchfieldia salsa]
MLSVSVDIQGPEVCKPYTEGTSFTTVVDSENELANFFGFKIVPNGIFIDKEGTIRLLKQGFHVTNNDHIHALKNLIEGKVEQVLLDDEYYSPKTKVISIEKQLSETKFRLGMEYAKSGKIEEALNELDQALQLDTDNFLIRKQRWYIRFPEKFAPTIDIEWQQKQLEKERAEESQVDCGPEGCIIPGTTKNQ